MAWTRFGIIAIIHCNLGISRKEQWWKIMLWTWLFATADSVRTADTKWPHFFARIHQQSFVHSPQNADWYLIKEFGFAFCTTLTILWQLSPRTFTGCVLCLLVGKETLPLRFYLTTGTSIFGIKSAPAMISKPKVRFQVAMSHLAWHAFAGIRLFPLIK